MQLLLVSRSIGHRLRESIETATRKGADVFRRVSLPPLPQLPRAISPPPPSSLDFVILIFALFTVSPSCIYPRCERHDDCGRIIL